jgi:hypothetical protein
MSGYWRLRLGNAVMRCGVVIGHLGLRIADPSIKPATADDGRRFNAWLVQHGERKP